MIARAAAADVAGMTTAERVGELVMTAATAGDFGSLGPVVARYHLGGVMVRGRSSAGTAAVRRVVDSVQSRRDPGTPPLLIATDQEGGEVQVLSGPGFATIPSAVEQATLSTAALQNRADGWGRSLSAAGVNLDLGPVADVPCAADLHDNPPIADLDRNYGTDPGSAGTHVAAFVRGMRGAGVDTTVKHFPGLGCVRENTDTTANVVDASTTTTSVRLRSFAAGIDAGAPFVMVSSATYSGIDPGVQALFSHRIVTGLLRNQFSFGGVVMTDDVGAAVAVAATPVGQRAVRFVSAGGDLILDIEPAAVPELTQALTAACSSPAFAAQVRAAATRVLAARLTLAAR